jgi:2-hydroxychromene-2-carboxylate isomerase
MTHIDFHLDFVSPYAYLAFERLPEVLEGLSCEVAYKPIVLGALFRHHGHTPPVTLPAKRTWIYRHALWLGQAHGIPIELPAAHPYDPLPHLRLALATTRDGAISRLVAETIFRDIWRGGGADAVDPARLAQLAQRLPPAVRDGQGEAARAQLRANTAEAIASGVFGVPACVAEGRLFWGFEGLEMLRAALRGEAWFDGPSWHDADRLVSTIDAAGRRTTGSEPVA